MNIDEETVARSHWIARIYLATHFCCGARLCCVVLPWLMGPLFASAPAVGQQPYRTPRVELVPAADHQVSFRVAGVEKTRWHFGTQYPRPFFFPFNGPAGASLTRMGHPGAANHDHHRSVWLAHQDVAGVNFWTDRTDAEIRQRRWYAYVDGDDEAIMATQLGWYDGDGRELMQQDVIAALRPLPEGEHALELQIVMRPGGKERQVRLGKTNFGFLAVRVAKSLSVHFGGGAITNSDGQRGEAAIFGKQARWMDYSGPVAVGKGDDRKTVAAGVTYFDHPDNPRYPSAWHVREDGWMGAAFCLREAYTIEADEPLTLRYLLHAHAGEYDAARAAATHKRFAARPGFSIRRSRKPHRQWEVVRTPRK